jgi:hypothetical protein
VSEKSIPRHQAGLVRGAKTGRRSSADLAGACSGGKFVVSRAGGAYDARDRGPNRKFWLKPQLAQRVDAGQRKRPRAVESGIAVEIKVGVRPGTMRFGDTIRPPTSL